MNLRSNLRRPKKAAETEALRARDAALVEFKATEAPKIRAETLQSFKDHELPVLIATTKQDAADVDYAVGQVEYRSLVLQYFLKNSTEDTEG